MMLISLCDQLVLEFTAHLHMPLRHEGDRNNPDLLRLLFLEGA